MEVKQIEFQFKGARNYIHGTDMFNALMNCCFPITEISNIRFTVHDFVYTPVCQLYWTNTQEAFSGVESIRARCQYDVHGASYRLALVPHRGDAASGGRYPYDEEQIGALCRLGKDGISLMLESPFTFIENIVAMNKCLHEHLFPDAGGKWVFTRIDLANACEAREELSLIMRHNMNYRLTRSDILVGGQKIGDLFFSLVKA